MIILTSFVIITGSTSPTNGSVSYDQLQDLEFYPRHANVHPTTSEHLGYSEQSSDPSLHAEAKPEQPADDGRQLIVMPPIGVGRQQQNVLPFSLVAPVNIPVKVKDAMKFIVIGHYVDVFRSIYCYFENVVQGHSRMPFTGFSEKDGIILDFGLGTKQHLPVQALNHPAFAHCDEYEQLIMEAILIAPNPEKNLATFLEYPNLKVPVPESLQLLYRARLPSVATNQKLQSELAWQSRHLANWLTTEAGFASNKRTLYLSHVYDAIAFISSHQWKADFHAAAMEERQKYKPQTDFEKVILKLVSICSAQSQGYAYAEMVTNGMVVQSACSQSMVCHLAHVFC